MKAHTFDDTDTRVDWIKSLPIFAVWGVALIGPFFTGISWISVGIASVLYVVRMFFVTGFLHRYFSHRSFESPVWFQYVMAVLSCTAVQKGPLWWAYVHRHHHQHSDTPEDAHSTQHHPGTSVLAGFWWAHAGWILCGKHHGIPKGEEPKDLVNKNPGLLYFEKPLVYITPAVILGALCYFLGEYLGQAWNTNGAQMVVVGFFGSTFVLFNGTSAINSLAHLVGKARYDSGDHSKNCWWLALITLGEGWHNNHHKDQIHVNQAETRAELWLDWTYWGLYVLSLLGIITIDPRRSHITPRKSDRLLPQGNS